MSGLEVVIGVLVARVVARQKDTADSSPTRDIALDRVHDLVTAKLHNDPALDRLQNEAAGRGEVTARTQARVRMSLEDAVEEDRDFAERLTRAVQLAQEAMGLPAQDIGGNVINQITGTVSGHVVQARDIRGNVSF